MGTPSPTDLLPPITPSAPKPPTITSEHPSDVPLTSRIVAPQTNNAPSKEIPESLVLSEPVGSTTFRVVIGAVILLAISAGIYIFMSIDQASSEISKVAPSIKTSTPVK